MVRVAQGLRRLGIFVSVIYWAAATALVAISASADLDQLGPTLFFVVVVYAAGFALAAGAAWVVKGFRSPSA